VKQKPKLNIVLEPSLPMSKNMKPMRIPRARCRDNFNVKWLCKTICQNKTINRYLWAYIFCMFQFQKGCIIILKKYIKLISIGYSLQTFTRVILYRNSESGSLWSGSKGNKVMGIPIILLPFDPDIQIYNQFCLYFINLNEWFWEFCSSLCKLRKKIIHFRKTTDIPRMFYLKKN
jgi:hypothetical protein